MRKKLTFTALAAAPLLLPAFAEAQSAKQMPAYIQLQRDVVINSDLWSDRPEILAANWGFEGIIGVPGLQTADDLALAVAAGAGVNLDWAQLDPLPPLRNLTAAASPLGVAAAGFGGSTLFGDAMPIEVSWPILPSSLAPDNITIRLNTGEVVTPAVAALNPNYDHNERHVIVVFGEFGNRIAPGEPGAVYPVEVSFVAGSSPLMAVGPDGPVSIVGLSKASSNPFVAGPALVGAKLSHYSGVGDFAPAALSNASPNDAFSLYGEDAQYRLRLFTSGGFSPDGVSGLMPTDFENFFRLLATDAEGREVVIDEAGRVYDLGVGKIEVVGLAEVGAPVEGEPDRAYYAEDHDNYFDVVLKGDEAAIRLIHSVEIPTSSEPGYLDIYNPGGPGRTPQAGTVYTKAALPQIFRIYQSLDFLNTVSYASQDWRDYDLDDDLPVVFRVRRADGAERLTTSTNIVSGLVAGGQTAEGVDFANETARPGVSDVEAFHEPATGDRIYTLDEAEQAELSADPGWQAEGRAFGAFASAVPGSDPVFRFYDSAAGWHLFTPDLGVGLTQDGVDYQGIGWYSAVFPAALPREIRFDRSDDVTLADPFRSSARLTKAGCGTLTIAAPIGFARGTRVEAGRLQVEGLLSGGPVSVAQGGTLGGNGIVGARTEVAGRLAPGSSPGTLVFLAPVTIEAEGELEIEADGPRVGTGAGAYDRLLVLGAGNSFTAGGTLKVKLRGISGPAENDFTPELGRSLAGVVTAQGGLGGSFAGLEVTGDVLPAGTRLDALYHAQTLNLAVTPESYGDLSVHGVALRTNEAAVGKALDIIRPAPGVRPAGAASGLFAALAPLSAEEVAGALDDLGGQIHADALDATADGYRLLQKLVGARLAFAPTDRSPSPPIGAASAAGAADADPVAPPATKPLAAWAQAFGSVREQREAEGIEGYDSSHRGLAVGADRTAPDGLRLGFALGQMTTEATADDGYAEVDSVFAALYAARPLGGFTLSGQLLGSFDDYDSDRSVRMGTLGWEPEGSTHGWGLAGSAALGRRFPLAGGLSLEPAAGLSFARLEREGFTETDGGEANLEVERSVRGSLRSRLGATLGYGDEDLAGALSLGWSHEFLDEAATSSASLAGAAFTTRAAAPGRDFLDLGAGVRADLGSSLSLSAGYQLSASAGTTAHSGMVSLRLTW